jgi:carboxymethylenebutenolidase
MVRRLSLLALTMAGACTLQRTPTPASPSRAFSRQSVSSTTVPMPMAGMDDHMAHMMPADRAASAGRVALTQDVPGLPASNGAAAARLEKSPRHGEWVKIAMDPGSADSIMAWLVYPIAANARAKAPVVVVVHEIFGLSTWVRGVADQVAADGFIAIAPDFLSRVRGGPSTVELARDSATKLINSVNVDERNRIIKAVANYAMMLPAAQPKYAVIGYCWGGQTVWAHAVDGGLKGFSGGVPFYGAPPSVGGSRATATTPAVPATADAAALAKINVPIMLLNGSTDTRITALMPATDSIMKANKKDYVGINYDGAVHGFLREQAEPRAQRNEAAEIANVAATKDAWPRTITFLRKQLGVK